MMLTKLTVVVISRRIQISNHYAGHRIRCQLYNYTVLDVNYNSIEKRKRRLLGRGHCCPSPCPSSAVHSQWWRLPDAVRWGGAGEAQQLPGEKCGEKGWGQNPIPGPFIIMASSLPLYPSSSHLITLLSNRQSLEHLAYSNYLMQASP